MKITNQIARHVLETLIRKNAPNQTLNLNEQKLMDQIIKNYSQISTKPQTLETTYNFVQKIDPSDQIDLVDILFNYDPTRGLEENYIKDFIMSQVNDIPLPKGEYLSYQELKSTELLDAAYEVSNSVVNITINKGEKDGWGNSVVTSGSGLIAGIDSTNGKIYISTNKHVAHNGSIFNAQNGRYNETKIDFNIGSGNQNVKAIVTKEDPNNDLALIVVDFKDLSFNPHLLKTVEFANSDNLKLGNSAFTYGKSLEESQEREKAPSVAFGSITAFDKTVISGATKNEHMMQLRIKQAEPGRSGSGVWNEKGQLTGILTSISSEYDEKIKEFEEKEYLNPHKIIVDEKERSYNMQRMVNSLYTNYSSSNSDNLVKFRKKLDQMLEAVDYFDHRDTDYKQKFDEETLRKSKLKDIFDKIYEKISKNEPLTTAEKDILFEEAEKITKKEIELLKLHNEGIVTASAIPANIVHKFIQEGIKEYEIAQNITSDLSFPLPQAEKNIEEKKEKNKLILASITDEDLKKLLVKEKCFQYINEIAESKYMRKREISSYLQINNQDLGSLAVEIKEEKVTVTIDENIAINVKEFFKITGQETNLIIKSLETESKAFVEVMRDKGKTIVKMGQDKKSGETASFKLSEFPGAKIAFNDEGKLFIKCKNEKESKAIKEKYKNFEFNGQPIQNLSREPELEKLPILTGIQAATGPTSLTHNITHNKSNAKTR